MKMMHFQVVLGGLLLLDAAILPGHTLLLILLGIANLGFGAISIAKSKD